MHHFTRGQPPDCLTTNGPAWSQRFVARRAANPTAAFNWNRSCYADIRAKLSLDTSDHCAFCDSWPYASTVEHFRPKSKFPQNVCDWDNLFAACSECQNAKREHFDPLCLRGDDVSYRFDVYFDLKSNYEIQPNPAASPSDQRRAEVTIELYKLNRGALVLARREKDLYSTSQNTFRYMNP